LWIALAVVVALLLASAIIVAVAVAGREAGVGPGGERAHALSAPRDGRDTGTLRLAGADTIRVSTGDLGDDLYRVSTPDAAPAVPEVRDTDDAVIVDIVASDGGDPAGPVRVDVVLSSAVTWRIELAGGAGQASFDLVAGGVSEVDIEQGVTRVEVRLGQPAGTLTVQERAGVSDLTVLRPAGVPARAIVGNGAGSVSFDGAERPGVAGGTVFATDGWDAATDRVDIRADGGVSRLVVGQS
jgi:hypothetical protein